MKKKSVKQKYNSYDLQELACEILNIKYDAIDTDIDTINKELYNKFKIDLENFTEIVLRLLPIITVAKCPISNQIYKGFSNKGKWLLKIKY